jgi:hypothetical protein
VNPFLAPLACSVLFVASAARAADDTAEAVVKKAIDAHGGADALTKHKAGTYKVKGDMTVAGTDVSFTGDITYELPTKFRMALDADVSGQKLALVQVVNGTKVKNTVNGTATKLGKAQTVELIQAAAMQEISQLTPLLDAKKYTIKLEKDEEVDGKPAAVVLVTGKNFKDTRLSFDKASGLMVKTSRRAVAPEAPDDKEVVEDGILSGYKKVEGVMVPGKIAVTHDGKKFMTMTVVETALKEKVDPKNFDVDD